MYGSQTGNAQSIAEGVHQGCKERGLTSTLLACDGWKKVGGGGGSFVMFWGGLDWIGLAFLAVLCLPVNV